MSARRGWTPGHVLAWEVAACRRFARAHGRRRIERLMADDPVVLEAWRAMDARDRAKARLRDLTARYAAA